MPITPSQIMALIKCKECGGAMSSSASKCPKCGKSRSTVTGIVIAIIIGIVAFIVLRWFW
jgi:RNA polymerase subunit RPABC4/transcription elongation factor Spt4